MVVESKEVDALRANLLSVFSRIVSLVPYLPEELEMAAANVEEPGALAFLVASTMRIKTEDKQELLEEADIEQRLRKLTRILARELEVLELGSKIQSDVQLRDRQDAARVLPAPAAQGDPAGARRDRTSRRPRSTSCAPSSISSMLPDEVRKAAEHELERLAQIQPASAEYTVIRTYLDWIVTLPWNISSDDNLDIEHAREILDHDHYDLEKVKDRILEYLAVRKPARATCTGRSSASWARPASARPRSGSSIAEALGRKFVRISVGGVRDEAEIRGHRRTYVGAMPGRSSCAPCATPAPTTRCS